jgi:hypothetical protein
MKKQTLQAFLILALVSSSGCAVSTAYVQEGSKTYEQVDPKTVKLFASDTIPNHYYVIGSVAADKIGDGNDVADLLREKAASLGANAIISARLTKIGSATSRTGLSGVAVRTY